MPISDAHDVSQDGWSRPLDDGRPPESGERERGRRTWLGRLIGAVLPAREAAGARAVRGAAEALERDGGMVFANVGGWPRPPVVGGFVPDVYAVLEDREVVLDVARGAAGRRREVAFVAWAEAASRRVYQQIVVEAAPQGRGS